MTDYSRWEHRELRGLVGQTIRQVQIDDGGTRAVFVTNNGTQTYEAEGDCCSKSWIEHADNPEAIIGSPVLEVRDESMGEDNSAHDNTCDKRDLPRVPRNNSNYYKNPSRCWCDVIKVYQYVIKTAQGSLALEMRNSSNGYYGGSLERVS